jgi:hypothetical protein
VARVEPVALKAPARVDLEKALGKEKGALVSKVFDGATWVPRGKAFRGRMARRKRSRSR